MAESDWEGGGNDAASGGWRMGDAPVRNRPSPGCPSRVAASNLIRNSLAEGGASGETERTAVAIMPAGVV